MTTPPEIEKQLVDINFSKGLNEAVRPEHMDWTNGLKAASNVNFDEPGHGRVRNGVQPFFGLDSEGNSYGPVYRLLPTNDGLGFVGKDWRMYHVDEGTLRIQPQALLPDFSVEPTVVSSWPDASSQSRVIGTCMTGTYRVLLHSTSASGQDDGRTSLVIVDRYSNCVVRSYQIPGEQVLGSSVCMCLVGGQYVHVYVGSYLAGSGVTVVYQFDLDALPQSLPSKLGLSNDHRVVGCVGMATSSVVLMENGWMSRVSTTPAEIGTAQATGFAMPGGIDADASGSIYVSGVTATPRKMMKVYNSLLTLTRTVTGTATDIAATEMVRIAVGSSGSATLVSYHAVSDGLFVAQVDTCGTSDTNFTRVIDCPNWGENSLPFCLPNNQKFYVAWQKEVREENVDTATVTKDQVAGAVVVVCLSDLTWNGYGKSLRIAAALDSYQDAPVAHAAGHANVSPQRPFYYNGFTTGGVPISDFFGLTIGGAMRSTFGSVAFEFRELRCFDVSSVGADVTTVSGGIVQSYDGLAAQEYGFVDTPFIKTDAQAGATAMTPGRRSYVAVFEFKDLAGRSHFSRCSLVSTSVVSSGGQTEVTVSVPTVTNHQRTHNYFVDPSGSWRNGTVVRIYRTVSGGTQYHLLTESAVDGYVGTSCTFVYTDTTPDASLESKPLLYRQPGTSGTALDRYHAVAGRQSIRFKDRIMYFRGNSVFYSSFSVDGESGWFSPVMKTIVDDGHGLITGLSQMDGVLVVFKRNNIFLIDGDGPPENGGSGLEFSPPRRIMTEYGCVDSRTILTTPNGIMFRSSRGLEILKRSMQVEFLGDRVNRTVDANPYVGGAAFDRSTSRCVWLMGNQAADSRALLSTAGNGVAVVYEVNTDTWTTYTLYPTAGYGKPFTDVAYLPVRLGSLDTSPRERLFFSDAGLGTIQGRIWREVATKRDVVPTESGNINVFIPVTMETGWVKATSKQERIRVSDLLVCGLRSEDFTLTVDYAKDYVPSYSNAASWGPSVTSALTFVQLEAQPPRELCQAMSFRVVTSDPTPTSFGNGSQLDIFGLSVRVGVKGGGAKVAATQKG